MGKTLGRVGDCWNNLLTYRESFNEFYYCFFGCFCRGVDEVFFTMTCEVKLLFFVSGVWCLWGVEYSWEQQHVETEYFPNLTECEIITRSKIKSIIVIACACSSSVISPFHLLIQNYLCWMLDDCFSAFWCFALRLTNSLYISVYVDKIHNNK